MHSELSVSLKPRAHAIAESQFSLIILRRILEAGSSIFQKIQRVKNILENLPKSIDLGPFRARRAQDLFSASKHVYNPCIFAVKVDVDEAIPEPFGYFLYPSPPYAPKIGPMLSQGMKSMHFLRSKWMSMTPLSSNLATFYTPVALSDKIWPRVVPGHEIYAFLRSKWMSMSPLSSRLATFYTPVRPVRPKLASCCPRA